LKERSQKVALPVNPAQQLPLFVAEDNPLVKELRNLNLNELTPLEALKLLFQWQKRLKKKEA
jgi:hypothetical protein